MAEQDKEIAPVAPAPAMEQAAVAPAPQAPISGMMQSAELSGGLGGLGAADAPGDQASELGGGRPMGGGIRAELEAATGHSLGGVSLHDGPAANQKAQSHGAQAVTLGQDIHFGAGMLNTGTSSGRGLLAHEAVHTIQQRGARPKPMARHAVSRPTDGHEVQAESFGQAFATGVASPTSHPIAAGSAGASVMRRGEEVCSPSVEELAAPVRDRLREIRSQGPEALAAEVRLLRGQADGDALVAINLAVEQVLSDDEKAVLEGRPVAPAESPPVAEPAGDPPAGDGGEGTDGDGGEGAGGDGAGDGTVGGDEAPEAVTDGESPVPAGGAEPQADGPAPAPAPAPAPVAAAPTTAQALQPIAPMAPEGRALVEQELGFHESWAAMSGGTGSRLAELFASDRALSAYAAGGQSALLEGGGALAMTALASKVPLPGLGNIIGGGLGAFALFGNDMAGLKSMTGDISNAFSTEGKGGWQIAADVIQGIKSFLDLVGTVCNILSGLAYAFAAIAAVGGLLSFFFPPLAMLVPYIPTAINFGRMCGGVASVCIGVADLISPIPPALRMIHILVSDQDPVRLVEQESQFHDEMAGAIGNYGGAAIAGAGMGAAKADPGGRMRGAARGAVGAPRGMVDGVRDGAGATRAAASDMRGGNGAAREALGMTNARPGDNRGLRGEGGEAQAGRLRQDARNAADGGANQQRATTQQEQADGGRQRSETDAAGSRSASEQARARAIKAERAANRRRRGRGKNNRRARDNRSQESQHSNDAAASTTRAQQQGQEADAARYRGDVATGRVSGDPQGNVGDMADSAVGTAQSGDPSQGEAQGAPFPLQHNEQGHVVLPPPPGTLQAIDALDAEIQQKQQQLAAQQDTTVAAQSVEADAGTRAAQLQGVGEAVQARGEDHSGLQTEHDRVGQQQTQVQQDSAQNQDSNDQALQQAAQVLGPIAGPARTVNGVVQQVPSNRFFDVSGTQQNMAELVEGIDSITGDGDTAREQREATDTVLAERDTQITDAATQRGEVVAQVSELGQTVQGDQTVAEQVQGEAAQAAQASQQGEATIQQQIETARQQRGDKWQTLLGWANNHYVARKSVPGTSQ